MSSRLSERLNVFPAGVWVSAADYSQFLGVSTVVDADDGETVIAQLRKATSSGGANAADFGAAVAKASSATNSTIKAAADGRSDELGQTVGGVPYTHVSLTASDTSTPEAATGVLIAGDARFSEKTLAGLGLSGI